MIDVTTTLLGNQGGVFGAGIGVGIGISWTFFQKNVLKFHTKQIDDVRKEFRISKNEWAEKLVKQEQTCSARTQALESRIIKLEDERVAILRGE